MIATIEDYIRLTVKDCKRLGYFVPQAETSGVVRWTQGGNVVASVRFSTNLKGAVPFAVLNYTYKGEPVHTELTLRFHPSNLKGETGYYYFVCPVTGLSCRNLYLVEGRFVSRTAFRPLYRKQAETKIGKRNSSLAALVAIGKYEQLATAEPVNGHSPMQDVIATHEAHQGDLYFIPAGRLHAIGAGNFLVEIQQTSDITYRVYDFGRVDAAGKPRELHIEQAKEAIDYQVWPEYRTSYDSTKPNSELIHCPYFTVNRVVVQVAAEVDLHTDSFVVVVCLWGEANINGIRVKQGETLLVPASENVLYIFGNATFLTATM